MTPERLTALAQLAHLTVLLWDRIPANAFWTATVHQTQGDPHLALERLIAEIEYSKHPIPLHEIETELLDATRQYFWPDMRGPEYLECRPGTRCSVHGYYDDPEKPNPGRDSFSAEASVLAEEP